jgi:hypothetical protein
MGTLPRNVSMRRSMSGARMQTEPMTRTFLSRKAHFGKHRLYDLKTPTFSITAIRTFEKCPLKVSRFAQFHTGTKRIEAHPDSDLGSGAGS